jgi:nitrous oxidase accessory protein NosD
MGDNLQLAMEQAPRGSTLIIDGVCVGPFAMDRGLTLEGSPGATLSGGGRA